MRWRLYTVACAALLVGAAAGASENWTLFGAALGTRSGCTASYNWSVEPVFHNQSDSDRTINVLHQSGPAGLPPSITVPAGQSVPLSGIVSGPPLGLFAVDLDAPADVFVESRLQVTNVQPCVAVPPSGPFGGIPFPLFHIVNAGQPQHHYNVGLGIQDTRMNVGIYNAGSITATATVEVRRPACSNPATTVVTVPPDSVVQTRVAVPPLCAAPAGLSPFWMLNATVTVDEPSFSYATSVSNAFPPTVTFGTGAP
jgi:hypothetical protein